MFQLKTLKVEILNKLKEIMPQSEAHAEADFLLEEVLNVVKKDFYLKDIVISDEDKEKILDIVQKRVSKNIPMAYLLNKAYFMGDVFYVDENVLIPRPETELLVRKALSFIDNFETVSVLDIGTGSGIIPIEILKNLKNKNIKMSAVDISENALLVAQKNSKNYDVSVKFIHSDLFQNLSETFDIIVSNPPYIPHFEKQNMDDVVLNHEPHSALFAEEDGLEFYKKIIEKAPLFLNKNGYILFELGVNQYNQVADLLEKDFCDISFEEDLNTIKRVISARLK